MRTVELTQPWHLPSCPSTVNHLCLFFYSLQLPKGPSIQNKNTPQNLILRPTVYTCASHTKLASCWQTEVSSKRFGRGVGQAPGLDPYLIQAFIPSQPAWDTVTRPETQKGIHTQLDHRCLQGHLASPGWRWPAYFKVVTAHCESAPDHCHGLTSPGL